MILYEIPLTSKPDQKIRCVVPIDGNNVILNFRIRFNTQANYWCMTVADKNNKVLIDSVPLLVLAYPNDNILMQYAYLHIGSARLINTCGKGQDSPDDTNLGTTFKLYWGSTDG